MKIIINNNIHSGACHLDPNIELTEAASEELFSLISKCKNKTDKDKYKGHFHGLGKESFTISVLNEELYTIVMSTPGVLTIGEEYFSDDENINGYLVGLFDAIVLNEEPVKKQRKPRKSKTK